MWRTAIKAGLVIVALGFLGYQVWSVGAADAPWRPGDMWAVRVERVQVFVGESSPPWAEVNRLRFEVLRVKRAVEGTRIQVRVTFDRPVLNGYTLLDLTYDADTLTPLSGRLTAYGRPAVDWKIARPLLEASLIPLQGLSWQEVSADRLSFQAAGRTYDAYRVEQDGREYGWAEGLPWWLWYKAGEQVRAELVDCSCWASK
jgi:hypothetical protein